MDRIVLAVDVGGSHVKVLLSSGGERRRFDSGPDLTPQELVEGVTALTRDWAYDVISVGVPTPVKKGRIVSEPVHLGRGWVGFDFEAAFGKPTRVVNDAAMQALGSYEGGKMLFLGLGTGLGSALIDDGKLEPLELGHLPFRKATYEDYVGRAGRKRLGKKKWHAAVAKTIEELSAAFQPDYVMLGGGNAQDLGELPAGVRLGANTNAFVGGFRLWDSSR
jgi:polyphosphate glucokinase